VWRSEDQAITETRVPNAVAGLAATDSVASAGPYLQLMATSTGPACPRTAGAFRNTANKKP